MTQKEHDSQNQDPGSVAPDTASSGEGSAPISLDDSTIEALLAHPSVEAKIEAIAQAKTQGTKDRRIAKMENQLGDISGILDQLDLTLEQKDRLKDIERDNTIKQMSEFLQGQGQASSGDLPASESPGKTVDIVGSFKAVGYDPASITSEDLEFASKFSSEADLQNALLKQRIENDRQEQASTVEGGVMPMSGQSVNANTQAQLKREYEDALSRIRKGDADAVANLKAQFRKKGLPIH